MNLLTAPSPMEANLEYVWPAIREEMRLRREDRAPLLDHMMDVQRRYNGEWAVPYPGKDKGPDLPPLGPAIIADTIDTTGMTAGSIQPEIFCPSMEPGVAKHELNARKRKQSLEYAWWSSGFNLLSRKWFRQLAGYGTFGILVTPDFDAQAPKIRAIDPLGMFPEERAAGDLRPPSSVGIIHLMHKNEIMRLWPQSRKEHGTGLGAGVLDASSPNMWEVLEWVDENQRVFGILGPRDTHLPSSRGASRSAETAMPLHYSENPVGVCTMLTPERVTLEKVVSQVQNILGMTDLMSRLMALDILSSEKSIFPDRVILGNSNNPPILVDGTWHDGIDGKVNMVLNADQVMTLNNSPDRNVKEGVDRLERNSKVSGGLVPQQVGETPGGGLRTGRANDALFASAVEPRMQEMHEIFEYWAGHMNDIVIETYKAYWPQKKYVVFSGQRSVREVARFRPSTHLDVSWNKVSYAIPGASSSRVTVELAQLYGADAISMKDFRRMHPNIADAEATEDQVNVEAIDRSLRRFIEVGIEQGSLTGEDLAVLGKALKKGTPLIEAHEEMLTEARERQQAQLEAQAQAAQGEPPPLEALPGANPPDAEGLGAAGLGGPPAAGGLPQPEPTVGPSPNQAGLFNLIGATQAGLS